MTSDKLKNLVQVGSLLEEAPRADELEGLLKSGLSRLADATRSELSFHSQFDLAYNSAHSLALCALRRTGFRPNNKRYIVFQTLPLTIGLKGWRVLDKAHKVRNLAEYEGYLEQDDQLLADLLEVTRELAALLTE